MENWKYDLASDRTTHKKKSTYFCPRVPGTRDLLNSLNFPYMWPWAFFGVFPHEVKWATIKQLHSNRISFYCLARFNIISQIPGNAWEACATATATGTGTGTAVATWCWVNGWVLRCCMVSPSLKLKIEFRVIHHLEPCLNPKSNPLFNVLWCERHELQLEGGIQ